MRLPATLTLTLALVAGSAHAAGDLNAAANASGSDQIVFDWSWTEYDPSAPVERPDWAA